MKKYMFQTILILMCLYGPAQGSPTQADLTDTATGRYLAEANLNPEKLDSTQAPVTLLTLARAKQTALENSPTLAAARERVAQAVEAIAQAQADYMPTIGLNSSWDYSEETEASLGTSQDKYTNAISATQVLFQGFYRKYNTLSAKYGEKMNLAAHEDAQRTLIWSVSQSYLNAQQALENIRIAQSDMSFNLEQEKEAEAKERMGTGSYSDVLNFKTKVNSAKSEVIQAQQDFQEACYGLAALMGYEDSRLPEGMAIQALNDLGETDNKTGLQAFNLQADILTVLEKRPDLKEDRLAVQDAQARIERGKSGYFPTISLTGAYGASGVDDFDYINDDDYMGASVGVEVSFELFSGGSTRSAIRSVAAEKRALEKELDDARITATKEIRSAFDNVTSSGQKLELQQENTQLIKITRDLVKKEYDVGQASLVRLNEAQNDLVSAQGQLADAQVSLLLALEELDYYTGRNIHQFQTESVNP